MLKRIKYFFLAIHWHDNALISLSDMESEKCFSKSKHYWNKFWGKKDV